MTEAPQTYRAEMDAPADNTRCDCGDCDWAGTFRQLAAIGDCSLTPGDASPAGRCPECDSLAYVHTAQRSDILDQYPILRTIPEGATVTLQLRNGGTLHGEEATTDDDMKCGLVRITATNRTSQKVARYVHASDIVVVEIVYEEI